MAEHFFFATMTVSKQWTAKGYVYVTVRRSLSPTGWGKVVLATDQ